MFSVMDCKQIIRRSLFTCALLAALIAVGLVLNAVAARFKASDFEQARDFPRGALVYVQFSDLPGLVKQWEASELKSRYVKSASFEQFQTRHLALKLVSRWSEFNDASGFPLDAGVLAGLADDRAAVAIYDIGRLDMLLVAPLSEAKLAACRLFQNKANFLTAATPSGATYYLHDVEANQGRQKQRLGFAAFQGKLLLATDEQLLLRAIANLEGSDRKDRLTDEPSFQTLAEAVTPHFASVWVDQEKLNENPYFNNYWLMSNASDLKEIRAGMFDLELQQGKWVERREFLTTGNEVRTAAIPVETRAQLMSLIPADAPFVQLRSSGEQDAAILAGALFDRKLEASQTRRSSGWERIDSGEVEASSEEESDSDVTRYAYLNHRYDVFVDELENEGEAPEKEPKPAADSEATTLATIGALLKAAGPIAIARLARPGGDDGPILSEFGRAAVFALQTPAALDGKRLEQMIAQIAVRRLMIAGAQAQLGWKDQPDGGRLLTLPALGRSIGYGLRGSMLIVSNHRALLTELMKPQTQQPAPAGVAPVSELTVVRLSERKAAFDDVFQKLDASAIKELRRGREEEEQGASPLFFSGNLSSLLDVASPVTQLRIERRFEGDRMKEEVTIALE